MRKFLGLRRSVVVWLAGIALFGAAMAVMAATPPVQHHQSHAADLHAQMTDVNAKVSSARARNAQLQAQVAQMEQQNADRQKRLQQRDDEIAALQKKLQALGVPASAASTGP